MKDSPRGAVAGRSGITRAYAGTTGHRVEAKRMFLHGERGPIRRINNRRERVHAPFSR